MTPFLQDKIFDLLINIISIILGGGLVFLFIEWRRHKRERMLWQREDQLLQIDVPRAEILVSLWKIKEKTSDKEKLLIYENELENTVKSMFVFAEFVIKNTTGAEIIITDYDVDVLEVSSLTSPKQFYDSVTFDQIAVDDIGTIRLQGYQTIARLVILSSSFGRHSRLENVPATFLVEAKTSSGKIIQQKSPFKVVQRLPSDLDYYHDGTLHPKKYIEKIDPTYYAQRAVEEDDIPF